MALSEKQVCLILILLGVTIFLSSIAVHEIVHVVQYKQMNMNVKRVCFLGFDKKQFAFGWVLATPDETTRKYVMGERFMDIAQAEANLWQIIFIIIALLLTIRWLFRVDVDFGKSDRQKPNTERFEAGIPKRHSMKILL